MNSSPSSQAKVRLSSKDTTCSCSRPTISVIGRATGLTCATASEKCQQEKRKTVNGEDILFAMTSLGFENYGEALKIYLARYREVCNDISASPQKK